MDYHVLHPFTLMPDITNLSEKEINNKLIISESSTSSWIKDKKGEFYYNISNAALSLGSGQEDIINAAIKQYKKLSTGTLFAQGHDKANELARKLVEKMPDYNMAFYSIDGTGTTETALKIARQHFLSKGKTRKKKYISLNGGFHGNSYGSLSVTNVGLHDLFGPILKGMLSVNPPVFNSDEQDLEIEKKCKELQDLIEDENSETIAAMIIEPIQGVSGVQVIPKKYLQKVRELTKKHDILLIVDEVTTGIGRLGDWSANELMNINGDIVTFSKSLTSGYFPLGVTMMKQNIAESFLGEKNGGFPHGSTLSGHPVGCAIGLAVINKIDEENLLDNVLKYEYILKSELKNKLAQTSSFKEIRGKGLMIGIEFFSDSTFSEKFVKNLLNEGLLGTYGNGTLIIYPPFNLTELDAEFIIDSITKAAISASN
ncbi:aminotransferase family protein [Virgibacillus dokdonensis]|uniref:aminotransferase family protein n=1 Tax=Virgibacillus dokdonensis TaxID=302167 RepID=UPI00098B42D3|nr:aspartate aminotransferase family protein [Virgibacillus dokdonensis]